MLNKTGTICGYDQANGEDFVEIACDCCSGSALCRPGDLPADLPFEQSSVGRRVSFQVDCSGPRIEAPHEGKMTRYPLALNIKPLAAGVNQ